MRESRRAGISPVTARSSGGSRAQRLSEPLARPASAMRRGSLSKETESVCVCRRKGPAWGTYTLMHIVSARRSLRITRLTCAPTKQQERSSGLPTYRPLISAPAVAPRGATTPAGTTGPLTRNCDGLYFASLGPQLQREPSRKRSTPVATQRGATLIKVGCLRGRCESGNYAAAESGGVARGKRYPRLPALGVNRLVALRLVRSSFRRCGCRRTRASGRARKRHR